jgi:concentrative nucleoside transporter, CNT family
MKRCTGSGFLLLAATILLAPSVAFAQQRVAPPAATPGTLLERSQSLLGLVLFLLLAFAIGRARGARIIAWRTLLWGMALQFIFAIFVLRTAPGRLFFQGVDAGVRALLGFAEQGARFIFGNLVKNNIPVGTPVADPLMSPVLEPSAWAGAGAFFAFNVLPTIIFFSSLLAVLYHTGIMRYVVGGLAWVMQRSMKTSGAETLSAAANIFVGQTEAPLFVRPFVPLATQSELLAIMIGGFANIASGVLGAYVQMLQDFVPDVAGHLLSASIISAPASLVVAKLMMPETEKSRTTGETPVTVEKVDANTIDAASRGAMEGLYLSLNVAAMLIAFIALVALLNAVLGWVGGRVGLPGLSFEWILAHVMAPLAWLCGIPWEQAQPVGTLLGIKTVLNEFVAYLDMQQRFLADPHFISTRSAIIATYALCGFANFASVGIQIGGISSLAPQRRGDLSRIGLLAMVGGTIASLMTACVVGMLI